MLARDYLVETRCFRNRFNRSVNPSLPHYPTTAMHELSDLPFVGEATQCSRRGSPSMWMLSGCHVAKAPYKYPPDPQRWSASLPRLFVIVGGNFGDDWWTLITLPQPQRVMRRSIQQRPRYEMAIAPAGSAGSAPGSAFVSIILLALPHHHFLR